MEPRVSMDASGVSPRQEQLPIEFAQPRHEQLPIEVAQPRQEQLPIEFTQPRQEQLHIEFAPEPPLHWRLNVLLEDIASNISNAELSRIRILFRGIHEAEIVETEQQRKVMNIYEQLEQTRQELTNTESQAINRKEEIRKLQSALKKHEQQENGMKKSKEVLERKNMELLAVSSLLQRMRLPYPDGKAAMFSFRKAISEANRKQLDMNVVKRMVDANTLVVAAFMRSSNEAERKRIDAFWEQRRSQETELLHQILIGTKTATDSLLTKYTRLTLSVPLNINVTEVNIANEVSKHLTDRERGRLMEQYSWEENDLIKTCIDIDKGLFLLGLECKEAERTQAEVQADIFIRSLLKKVDRTDLENMYIQMLSEFQSQQQNIFLTETARHMQSLHQTTGLGQTAVNEIHQIHTNTTATIEMLKQVLSFLLKI